MKIWNHDEMVELPPCVDVEKDEMEYIHDLAKEMIETCISHGGVGLAAPQVGVNKNMFIYSPDAMEFHIVINPSWVPLERKKAKSVEQCLSLDKEDFYYVERYKYISVKYLSISPERNKFIEVNRRIRKDEAVVFQHESDHLKGVTLVESGVKL